MKSFKVQWARCINPGLPFNSVFHGADEKAIHAYVNERLHGYVLTMQETR